MLAGAATASARLIRPSPWCSGRVLIDELMKFSGSSQIAGGSAGPRDLTFRHPEDLAGGDRRVVAGLDSGGRMPSEDAGEKAHPKT
jgi:hypothetical protein